MQFSGKLLLMLLTFSGMIMISQHARAQSDLRQSIKGYVKDAGSDKPLAGVTVMLIPSGAGTVTDSNGYYRFHNIPLGRYSIQFSSAGFETRLLPDVIISSGKEQEQNITLTEGFKSLHAVVVTSSKNTTRPLNEFAPLSARSFSIEETKRYPAAFADPARMVMNFPGVSAADDGNNSIVVRGNSPAGVLWKLEGIEIPNPNHFSSQGSTGGAISMLSSNVIGRSDFYTGAFPAEIGNATSAAFDLNFRNGNRNRREYSVMLGTLGAELSAEGPLSKNKQGSYLINYRYSTLALLKHVIDLDGTPDYQDLSFKFNWQTPKAGEFTVFGLGGYNKYSGDAIEDSTKWDSEEPNLSYTGNAKLGVAGISNKFFTGSNAYIKTVLSASFNQTHEIADSLNPLGGLYQLANISQEASTNKAFRLSSLYNNKIDSRTTIRTGIIAQLWSYKLHSRYYDDAVDEWKQVLDGSGSTGFYQAFFQGKYRLNPALAINAGVHVSYLALNKKSSVEPRVSVSYSRNNQVFSLGGGLHSRPEHISTYLFNGDGNEAGMYPNKNLDFTRALHLVGGYEKFFSSLNLKTKTEIYYQHLYNVPVEANAGSGFSTINMENVYDLFDTYPLVNKGTGRNYGIDLSMEKPFSENYYFITAFSLFRSTFTNLDGDRYNTRYNRNYSLNAIVGKEWPSRRNENRLFGLNGKLLRSGGLRNSEIDIPASVISGKEELVKGSYYSFQAPAYFRIDATAYIKKEHKRSTHILSLEIQNLTNRENFYRYYFDVRSGQQKTSNQLGILPNLSYKIQFH